MNLARFAAVAALSLALMSACGGSPAPTLPARSATPQAQSSGPNVCALLTTQDLDNATRKEYQSGKHDTVDQCTWEGVPNAKIVGGPGDLLIGELTATDLATIKSTFGSGGKDETIDGHAAFYNPTEGVASLWVETDSGQLLKLTFPESGALPTSYEPALIELAEKALAKMTPPS